MKPATAGLILRIAVFNFLALAFTFGATAVAAEGITLVGEGARTCQTFTDDYADDPDQAGDVYLAWAQGYLVGINSRTDRFYDLRPGNLGTEEQLDIVIAYCDRTPKNDFIEAVRNLYQQIIVENIAEGR